MMHITETSLDELPRSGQISLPSDRFSVHGADKNYIDQLKRSYAEFLAPLKQNANEIVSTRIIANDYSHIKPDGMSENGPDLFENARLYDRNYSLLIRAEDRLVAQVCCPDFSRMFAKHKLPFDSMGPGTGDAVMKKDVPLLKALQSGTYTYNAVELDREIAKSAVSLVTSQLQNYGRTITARPYQSDFTQKWPRKLRHGNPRFSSMLGGTMGQFDMHEFFGHFNHMTEGNALLFFTLNCNRDNPEMDYSGAEFKRFKSYTWYLLKSVSQDPTFNASSARYDPDFDGEKVRHRYWFTQDTSVCIDGTDYLIPKGTTAITGYSSRPIPQTVGKEAHGTGMELVRTYSDYATNSHGFLLKGSNFPYTLN